MATHRHAVRDVVQHTAMTGRVTFSKHGKAVTGYEDTTMTDHVLRTTDGYSIVVDQHGNFSIHKGGERVSNLYNTFDKATAWITRQQRAARSLKKIKLDIPMFAITENRFADGQRAVAVTITGIHRNTGKPIFKAGGRTRLALDSISHFTTNQLAATKMLELLKQAKEIRKAIEKLRLDGELFDKNALCVRPYYSQKLTAEECDKATRNLAATLGHPIKEEKQND